MISQWKINNVIWFYYLAKVIKTWLWTCCLTCLGHMVLSSIIGYAQGIESTKVKQITGATLWYFWKDLVIVWLFENNWYLLATCQKLWVRKPIFITIDGLCSMIEFKDRITGHWCYLCQSFRWSQGHKYYGASMPCFSKLTYWNELKVNVLNK